MKNNLEQLPLVLRWRIHEGRIPLRQRHLRSLEPLGLPEPLRAWIHERLEWALANMLADDSEGVLVLRIGPDQEVTVLGDMAQEAPALVPATSPAQEAPARVPTTSPAQEVTVSLDPLREKPALDRNDLLVKDGVIVGAQYEGEALEGTVWLEYDGAIHASCTKLITATGTLAKDLLNTLKLPLIVLPQLLEAVERSSIFLTSDEFGFVSIQRQPDGKAPITTKLEECFSKLW